MGHDEIGRPSRWIVRAREWDDPRARYPNLWDAGMPHRIVAAERHVARMRLGDLVAVFHPASARHPERSERFVGLARVRGLFRDVAPGRAWVELETAQRFDPPLELDRHPRRTFLCCDPGWPEPDVELFERVVEAAVVAGWRPSEPERASASEAALEASAPSRSGVAPPDEPEPERERPASRRPVRGSRGRFFAGADYSGDMRDPRAGTWLALLRLNGAGLEVVRLEATGRAGLESRLRDPDRLLMETEAIGLDFPFGLPLPFAEHLLGGSFSGEGWWALARCFERLTRPAYLTALQDFREAHGEPKRWTDERARAVSPLHRTNPDLGPMTFHGIRMIAEDRSRYAIRPFESAAGRLLLEVYPGGVVRRLDLGASEGKLARRRAIVEAIERPGPYPVHVGDGFRDLCLERRDALDAVIAARAAAVAVLSGEAERTPEQLAPEAADRVRREGWIYGLGEAP